MRILPLFFFFFERGELLRAFNLFRLPQFGNKTILRNAQALKAGYILLNVGPSPISEGQKAGTFVHTWPFKSLNFIIQHRDELLIWITALSIMKLSICFEMPSM